MTIHRSRIAVVAPHAGRIEPFTGELATAVARDEHRLYCFAGRASSNNSRLHVTSTRFAEPLLSEVLRDVVAVVAIHGSREPVDAVTLIGGRNRSLRHSLGYGLTAAGFHIEPAPPPLAGQHPDNLTNRAPAGGVQLEISRSQRDELGRELRADEHEHRTECGCQFCRYVGAIRAALHQYALHVLPDDARAAGG